ncbi:MAG: hypothetical protein JXR76_27145 [Deltaproteobacteria bacterium]|nr:hypothetical protein [Deltaproteobacteria bacterium]
MKFLIASSEAQIAKQLALRGFTDADRKEGWDLLDRATGRHLAVQPGHGTFSTQYRVVLEKIDAFENVWFDVAAAALGRKFPAVKETLFLNLVKSSDDAVLLNVRTFLERIEALSQQGTEESKGALALLEQRGLSKEILDEGAALIQSVTSAQETASVPSGDEIKTTKENREAAIAEMWDWYLDWSRTARTVIKNRNYLIMLGLSSTKNKSHTTDELDSDHLEDTAASA